MRITILDDYQDAIRKLACFTTLNGHEVKIFNNTVKGNGQLAVRLRDAQALVLIGERTTISRALLDKLPTLSLIAVAGTIGPHIDLAACQERRIHLMESPEQPRAIAEFTWALLMAATRRVPQYISNLKHGAWQQAGLKASSMPPNFGMGQMLYGQTLGVWGYGEVGKLVAQFGQTFGMKVIIWSDEISCAQARSDGFDLAASKDDLFSESDIVSLHTALSDQTRAMVKLSDLQKMKPTALLINTAAAELIEPEALVLALNRGRPGMAAIDSFESEPILQGHALLRMENVICTPHISGVERINYEHMFRLIFDQISAYAHQHPTLSEKS